MLIGRVVGEAVSTRKHHSHEGQKALIVQPLNLDDTPLGNTLIALDAMEAGVGDRVLVTTEGYSAFTSVGLKLSPVDSAIIGIVDEIDLSPGSGCDAGR